MAIFFIDPDKIPLLGSLQFKVIYISIYLVFAAFLYFTVFQLLRVDMGKDKIYVSNYFKTYAYAYSDVNQIKEHNYGLFRLITITLKSTGSLGQKMTFIPSYKNYEFFIQSNPELFIDII